MAGNLYRRFWMYCDSRSRLCINCRYRYGSELPFVNHFFRIATLLFQVAENVRQMSV
jgi:hypothetical protein